MNAGWSMPGNGDITPIPGTVLLTSAEVQDARIERMTQSLFPDFSFEVMSAYSIRGRDDVFIPVRFKDTTEDLMGATMRGKWSFDAEQEHAEGAPTHVFTGNTVHAVTLDARDSLGFTERCMRLVDCRMVQPKEYAINADVEMLPSACYDNDIIEPVLCVVGSMPEGAKLSVKCERTDTLGVAEEDGVDVNVAGNTTVIPLFKTEVSELASVQWRIIHAGVNLRSGTIRFVRPPFQMLPARIENNSIYDHDGEQLVLVPHHNAGNFSQPSAPIVRCPRLMCLNDSSVSFLSGDPNEWKLPISGSLHASGEDTVHTYDPLARLLEASSTATSDVDAVVINIGCVDILKMMDVAIFEREAAALADIISATRKVPVIWMTPLPYRSDPLRIRPFAVAIMKVAAVRGMPVADIYTAFMASSDSAALFENSRDNGLSEHGRRFVAALVARCLPAIRGAEYGR